MSPKRLKTTSCPSGATKAAGFGLFCPSMAFEVFDRVEFRTVRFSTVSDSARFKFQVTTVTNFDRFKFRNSVEANSLNSDCIFRPLSASNAWCLDGCPRRCDCCAGQVSIVFPPLVPKFQHLLRIFFVRNTPPFPRQCASPPQEHSIFNVVFV